MIDIKDVLTATPVVIHKLPKDITLSNYVGSLIKGMNTASLSIDGYNLNNIATKLPEETGEGSEHDVLLNACSTKIATAIRDSLNVIRTYVIPSCDVIQEKIKSVGTDGTVTDMMFAKLMLNFYHIPSSLFESTIFPSEPDSLYKDGVKFTTSYLTSIGTWPERSYDEIIELLKPAMIYPELADVLRDKKSVEDAWKGLGKESFWLGLTSDSAIDPKNVDITPSNINTLIIFALLVTRFAGEEDPYNGVMYVSLDDYRNGLLKIKAFINTVLYYVKRRYSRLLNNGFIVDEGTGVKYEKCDVKESQFFGTKVLSGGAFVIYDDVIADFFANSDNYSLSSVIVGMLYSKAIDKKAVGENFLARVPSYQEMANEYLNSLITMVKVNRRNAVAHALQSALHELANGPLWRDYLSEDGTYKNLLYRLQDLIKVAGGIENILLSSSVIDDVLAGKLNVANTGVSCVLANVLGAPIAHEILANNIGAEASTVEKQRELLGRAVAKFIVNSLFIKQ